MTRYRGQFKAETSGQRGKIATYRSTHTCTEISDKGKPRHAGCAARALSRQQGSCRIPAEQSLLMTLGETMPVHQAHNLLSDLLSVQLTPWTWIAQRPFQRSRQIPPCYSTGRAHQPHSCCADSRQLVHALPTAGKVYSGAELPTSISPS